MSIITIPKKIIQSDDLIVMPRKEYEALIKLKKSLLKAENNFKRGKAFSYNKLIAPLKDPEGEYRESFVKKMLSRVQDKRPLRRFTDKKSFLKHVRLAK